MAHHRQKLVLGPIRREGLVMRPLQGLHLALRLGEIPHHGLEHLTDAHIDATHGEMERKARTVIALVLKSSDLGLGFRPLDGPDMTQPRIGLLAVWGD